MCKRILAQQTTPEGDVPFYKIGTIGGCPDAYISQELFDSYQAKYNYPRKGEILISCAGTVGRCVVFDGNPAYFQDSNIVWARNKEDEYTNDFLYYILTKQDWRHLNTTTIVRIYNNDLRALGFSCPSIIEQNKIATLLKQIDNRIATQNKIIEDLKKLKSAIYQNIFGTIEARTISLGNICNIVKGQQINGEQLTEQGKYYVMNGGIVPSGYYSSYNSEPKTISISEGGNSCGYVQYNSEPFWSGGHCYTLQDIAPDVNSIYLYNYLKYREEAIMKLRIGSGLPNIQKKDLSKFKVHIPTKKKQDQLEKFFRAIDSECVVEDAFLKEFTKQKQYLLQQMFI